MLPRQQMGHLSKYLLAMRLSIVSTHNFPDVNWNTWLRHYFKLKDLLCMRLTLELIKESMYWLVTVR